MNKNIYKSIKKQLNNFYINDINDIKQCCCFVDENNELVILANIKHASFDNPYRAIPVNTIMALKVEENGSLTFKGTLTYSTNSYLKTVAIDEGKCGEYSQEIFTYLETLAKINDIEIIETRSLFKHYVHNVQLENDLKQNNYIQDNKEQLHYSKTSKDFRKLESLDIKNYDFNNHELEA